MKAHPGQMAAPETRWATGHQPSRPHDHGGAQQAVRGAQPSWPSVGASWMSGTEAVGRALVVPKKHPSRVAPVSG